MGAISHIGQQNQVKASTDQYSVLNIYKEAAQKSDTEWNQLHSCA